MKHSRKITILLKYLKPNHYIFVPDFFIKTINSSDAVLAGKSNA